MLTFGTKSLGLEDLREQMYRVVESLDLRWLHVDPHWIGEALSGSRCLPNQSQVGLFHSAFSASTKVPSACSGWGCEQG